MTHVGRRYLDALRATLGDRLSFAPGFADEPDDTMLRDAVATAATADVVVVFLGLPDGADSEGWDREHLDLPTVQTRLLAEVARVNQNVVVVLAGGGVVRVSTWEHHAKAVLEGWRGGQAGGSAIADLLLGAASPSGRLAETIPVRLADTPAYLNFPGSGSSVTYGERIYVGYRYYDAKDLAVSYPFGHGLTYTTFDYTDLTVDASGEAVRVRFTLTNTGSRPGKEVAQVYVCDVESSVDRPVRELKAFRKVELAPGESAPVDLELTARDLSFFSPAHRRWVLEGGEFEIAVGASSRDLRLTATVMVDAPPLVTPLGPDATVGEWLAHPAGGPVLRKVMGGTSVADPQISRMIESLPLARLAAMSGGFLDLDQLLDEARVSGG